MLKVEIIGVNSEILRLKSLNIQKLLSLNSAIHNAGFYMVGEVQQSISGHRNEVRSVDTGRFLNSIPIDSDMKVPFVSVIASNLPYAPFLEFGTGAKYADLEGVSHRVAPRRHFTNSLERNKQKIIGFVNTSII